jgi:hypothetical protein
MLKSVSNFERKRLFIYLKNIGGILPKQFRESISYGGLGEGVGVGSRKKEEEK